MNCATCNHTEEQHDCCPHRCLACPLGDDAAFHPFEPTKPRLYVGQRVVVQSAARGERTGVIRRFKWGEDGENLVIVDLDPTAGRQPSGQTMGWVFDERVVAPLKPHEG